MKKGYFKWLSFFKRNSKLFAVCFSGVFFLWYFVDIAEWIYEIFDAELIGYGPPQQRWHRVLAMGFVGMYIYGTVLGLFNMWYYRRRPEDYRDE